MPIYLGSTKQGTLYYGGTKIKEAYYGSTKVYSSFTPETVRFNYTGAVQTWTVPAGVSKLIVDCVGAIGGATIQNFYGGKGGRVQCKLAVTSGQSLNIYVGGKGGKANSNYSYINGGWNGGGLGFGVMASGGGASDIRIGGTALGNRVIIAGGAGGSTYNGANIAGGAGGGLIGGNGNMGGFSYGSAATGGTQSAGGTGGWYGEAGKLGTGAYSGGGGGYYGGGGQGGNGEILSGTAGGGSSYTDPNLCTDVVHTQGYSEATGNGWIIITTSNQ